MAIYNVNQNRQFYVVNKLVSTTPKELGELQFISTEDGQFFFKHYGQGGLTRTDLIDVDKVCYTRLTQESEMRRYLKTATVALNPNINEGEPVSGQDYVLRIQINNYLSPGDASVLIKSAAVHATKNMTASEFYEKMVDSLEKNFSREPQPLLTFETSDAGIVITEVGDQPWRLGVLSQVSVNFEAIPTTIKYDSEDVVWGTTEYGTSREYVANGKEIADLEYFCQAERGDMFRNMGWPNNIDVKPMVDPSKAYSVLDLHYYFSGDGVQVHKSEKDITFVTSTYSNIILIAGKLNELGLKVNTKVNTVKEDE